MVPAPCVAAIRELVRKYKVEVEENVPADEVLKDGYKKYGKTGSVIRGCRAREDMMQIELAGSRASHRGISRRWRTASVPSALGLRPCQLGYPTAYFLAVMNRIIRLIYCNTL
jgi:hypothetical protein